MSDEEEQQTHEESGEEEEEEEVDEVFERIEEAKGDNVEEKVVYDEDGNPLSFTFNKVYMFGERGSGLRPRGDVQGSIPFGRIASIRESSSKIPIFHERCFHFLFHAPSPLSGKT
ncbi:uncharacterized protein LOC122263052 [Penaeus japonicus]|uniref:uncharacterized protein LOC122263052 n=1 Tax=Penaeus japonicus TaxID=27405 RepID=UPI001C714D4A|nr:uncharacterized protein LOC122263052 [Penaeus japonicus]